MTDSRGNKIYFSFDWDQQQERLSNGGVTRLTLTNGTWKIYNSTFTATGNDYETFVLGGIEKDDNGNTLVANGKIRVIVKPKGSEQFDTDWYFDENELFIQAFDSQKSQQSSQIISNSKIYDSDNKVYSVYLNSNKDWEIKFGNGVLGRKLNPGDEVYVIYLETNGEEGYIDMDKLGRDSVKLEFDPSMFGVNEETLCNMMKVKNFNSSITTEASGGEDGYEVEVIMDSLSIPKKQDDVTEIRENAPNWFKTGNRLITKKDYEYYIRQNTILSEVIDVKCMNNWDYMTTFYRWLYNLGLHPIDEYNVVLAQRGE